MACTFDSIDSNARGRGDAPGTPARHGSNATQSRATVESLIII